MTMSAHTRLVNNTIIRGSRSPQAHALTYARATAQPQGNVSAAAAAVPQNTTEAQTLPKEDQHVKIPAEGMWEGMPQEAWVYQYAHSPLMTQHRRHQCVRRVGAGAVQCVWTLQQKRQ